MEKGNNFELTTEENKTFLSYKRNPLKTDSNFASISGLTSFNSGTPAKGTKINLRWKDGRKHPVSLTSIEVIYQKISKLIFSSNEKFF